MSMVLTRAPLEQIGMNQVGGSPLPKRRSARLSADGHEENEPPSKRAKVNGSADAQIVSTKTQDGGSDLSDGRRKKQKVYDQESDGFVFTKSKRTKAPKEPTVRPATRDGALQSEEKAAPNAAPVQTPAPKSSQEPATETVRKTRRRLPTTPERDGPTRTVRKSKRLSDEPKVSPHKSAHARSHANTDRSPSPFRPVTVEKKRTKHADNAVEEGKSARITLPASDTPIIRRNKEMRKSIANGTNRRSSTGLRGRRASSLMDVGKGSALPHAEVPIPEFYKHISADLTEPRRMRLLLGWCGSRALPPKPEAPKDSSKKEQEEFQALQAARVIQDELARELTSNGTLSDWFSRDIELQHQPIVLKRKPNPRNVANAVKVEELERELERLRTSRREWDDLLSAAIPPIRTATPAPSSDPSANLEHRQRELSPPHPELLSSPQRNILEQLQKPADDEATDLLTIRRSLQDASAGLEFSIDTLSHSVHAIKTTGYMAEQIAERSLSDAATKLEQRQKDRISRNEGPKVDALAALKGLARVLNSRPALK